MARHVACEPSTVEAHMSKNDPLDGSVSGTIGGGGAETGGPTERPNAPAFPPVKPDNAASGRRAPDPLGATAEPDPPPLVIHDDRETIAERANAVDPTSEADDEDQDEDDEVDHSGSSR
jgi:hypothetical protein